MNIILNGSPNKDSKTLKLATKFIDSNHKIYTSKNISKCIDCGYCKTNNGCSVKDEAINLYKDINECNHLIISSPLHFGTISADTAIMISRFQTYFEKFNRKEPIKQIKKISFIVSGGGDYEDMFGSFKYISNIFKLLFKAEIEIITKRGTDNENHNK